MYMYSGGDAPTRWCHTLMFRPEERNWVDQSPTDEMMDGQAGKLRFTSNRIMFFFSNASDADGMKGMQEGRCKRSEEKDMETEGDPEKRSDQIRLSCAHVTPDVATPGHV